MHRDNPTPGYALTDDATVVYLTNRRHDPRREYALNPFDPELAIPWPTPNPVLSAKDRAAPTLRDLRETSRLPVFSASEGTQTNEAVTTTLSR
jgi:hypothetical protein